MKVESFITQDDVWTYQRDGCLLKEGVFSAAEIAAMIREVEGGSRVAQYAGGMSGQSGKAARLALWNDLSDDIWGAASTHPRIVNAVRVLMGEDIAFFHGKVMLKEARSGGAWEWHQDYGYWYNEGFAFPRMMSAFVALDEATIENGCLQVLKGSHHLGRLNHGKVGDQTGADAGRMDETASLFERVHCTMKPGSVLFFHCNLLHASASNDSPYPRRSFIMCYNALANPRLGNQGWPEQRPCPVGSADSFAKFTTEG